MEFRPSETHPSTLAAYAALFDACFPAAIGKLNAAYLTWLYRDNPSGAVVGFDAWEGGVLAAHYACVPGAAVVNGHMARVLLSLNTATHPRFQGKGLFTKLADATYQKAASNGFDAVYGIANANSTPGFLRKLGFALVSPLDAKIGLGQIARSDLDTTATDCAFQRSWSPRDVAWRISNPDRPYRLVDCGRNSVGAWCPTGKPGLVAWAELPFRSACGLATGRNAIAARLHLGLRPVTGRSRGLWVELPARFRSSPLNLIFRSLKDEAETIDADLVSLGQLDFDAF